MHSLQFIYHPKLYLVEGDKWACAVVGSANLTRDGLYRNVELATIIHLDLTCSADVEIYQYYDTFLSELLNPRNPNVQPLNEATLIWLAEMVIVEDETHVPEPQSVLRSSRATAKLKDLFPSLPVPAVPTASEVATVPNTGKEISAVPFEKLPSRSHKEGALPSVDEVASISSTITSPSSLSEGKLEETSRSETTSSPSSTEEAFHKEDMIYLLKQGAVVWNQWRYKHPEVQPDLSGTDLRILRGSSSRRRRLRKLDLRGVNLSGADLSETFLAGANLSKANLRNATLRKAILYRADLSGADLTGADLQDAILRRAKLFGAIFADVKIERTDFHEATLHEANIDEAMREEILRRHLVQS